MTPSFEQLRDIRGLDPMSWWPVAPGWWFLLAGVLLVALVLYLGLDWWRHRVGADWRGDARRHVQALRERLAWADARALAGELSEVLRRIAMARLGRRSCAGLANKEWLAWLEAHDPKGFAWRSEGQILIQLPYAPPGTRAPADKLQPLLDAVEEWTQPEEEPRERPLRRESAALARLKRWFGGRWLRGAAEEAHV